MGAGSSLRLGFWRTCLPIRYSLIGADWMSEWARKFFSEDYVKAYPSDHQTEAQVDGVIQLLDLSPPCRLLDLACGYGRHTLSLWGKGFGVFGLDNSANLLDRAARDTISRGSKNPPSFTQGDMRVLPYQSNSFDYVLSLFTSFGYFDTEEEDQLVLGEIARTLKPGGKFLLDVLNKEWLMAHFEKRFWKEGENAKLLNEMNFDYKRGRLNTKRVLIPDDGGKWTELYSSIRLYTLAEMIRMMQLVGIVFREVYGDYTGESYSLEKFRMIVIGEKSVD